LTEAEKAYVTSIDTTQDIPAQLDQFSHVL
jgi:hypothetical protein